MLDTQITKICISLGSRAISLSGTGFAISTRTTIGLSICSGTRSGICYAHSQCPRESYLPCPRSGLSVNVSYHCLRMDFLI